MSADQTYTLTSELREDWTLLQPVLWTVLFFLALVVGIQIIFGVVRWIKGVRKSEKSL